MKTAPILAVVFFIFLFPPVSALNCSLFEGDSNILCGMVDPLSLNEEEKTTLMQSDVYGGIEARNPEVSMKLNILEGEQKTMSKIYDDNIAILMTLLFLIFFNYVAFSIARNSSFLRKWLNADS